MKMREQTIASSIEFKGIGLHTGELATVRILPAPAGKGIIFRRVDLDNFELRADVASVARVAYATTLMSRGVWISTVEHLLSALYGVGVDNAYIELDNFEVPILDGSALPFTEGLARAGVVQQSRRRKYIRITKEFVLSDGGKTLGIYPSDSFSVKCDIDFPHPLIGKQSLDDTSLRFQDEFVRHKTLDLLGDFALIGQPVLGRLVANRAGHALHTRFVAELLESTSHWTLTAAAEASVSSAR